MTYDQSTFDRDWPAVRFRSQYGVRMFTAAPDVKLVMRAVVRMCEPLTVTTDLLIGSHLKRVRTFRHQPGIRDPEGAMAQVAGQVLAEAADYLDQEAVTAKARATALHVAISKTGTPF